MSAGLVNLEEYSFSKVDVVPYVEYHHSDFRASIARLCNLLIAGKSFGLPRSTRPRICNQCFSVKSQPVTQHLESTSISHAGGLEICFVKKATASLRIRKRWIGRFSFQCTLSRANSGRRNYESVMTAN
ncbi:hypothetical protein ACA910_007700 [Epithemia clementina (nom. ined.)]